VRKFVRYGLIAFGIVGAIPVIGELILLYDRSGELRWVGFTDLTVEFVVTDAETGRPIESAEILGYPEGGGPPGAEPIRWITDQNGVARGEVRRMCSGKQSRLQRTDTFNVHSPPWYLLVSAPGYEGAGPSHLNEPGGLFRGVAVRTGPGQSAMTVPIALRKSVP
jgi:hypothetical protein